MRGAISAGTTLGILTCLLGNVGPVAADLLDLTPSKDNTLFFNNVDASSGAGPALFSGRTGGLRRAAVLEFDIAGSLPPDAVVASVTLTLSIEATGPDASPTDRYRLYRLVEEWGEAGSDSGIDDQGALAQIGDATWVDAFRPTDPWTTAGGTHELNSQFVQFEMPVTGPSAISDPRMKIDVHDWLVDPASNHGWIVELFSGSDDGIRRFSSREGANPPLLTVEFVRPVAEAGAVANGDSVGGEPLRLDRNGLTLDFTWDQSCRFDADFSLYAGLTGQFYDHGAIACTTSGEREIQNVPINTTDGEYFLVVPISAAGNEGAHGFDGDGNPRPRGTGPSCSRPQAVADPVCP